MKVDLCHLNESGLPTTDFDDIFTRCTCERIITRRAFDNHLCRFTVIDLATDSEDGLDSEDSKNSLEK